jgi:TPR repeat protein
MDKNNVGTTNGRDDLWGTLAKFEDAEDIAGSLAFLLRSTLRDDPLGQRYIGWIYTIRNDFVVAGSWYLKSVQQGNQDALADCMECVIAMWRDGLHEEALALTASPPLSSLEIFQRFSMSRYFDLGNEGKMLEWAIRLAVSGKEADVMYAARLLVSRNDPAAAIPHLEASAERGSAAAHQLLGELHRRGLGVVQDELKANHHFKKAARHGYILSRTRLLHSGRASRGAWYLPIFAGRLLALMVRTVTLNTMKPSDPRLADLPNGRLQESA